ncbi:hypothetical protein A7U60_g1601 [Sanghuangporus baumii]|uniref:BTB domain-containing protein n=1 Tax=Sanghuangporus baumii TaxID=108892 RepID=A0A9Q5I4U0_SANBA|nr:hypothetical protein A7U60_g1601 [Sanghuangporus baumii]
MRTYSSLGNLQVQQSASASSAASSALQLLRIAHSDNDSSTDRMPTPNDIQSHLFSAFLSGKTADVALRVRGTWEGTYRLHRVVLIQAGFFRSLFDGGFREAAGKQGTQGEVSVTFDDPNITRAAFEICVSRLYGGGPALFLDPRLSPSRQEPLTPSFPRSLPRPEVPDGQHNATPRFLLSLLATAIYLSIPSVVSQAIQLVLGSLGPHTVIRYLNFAIGKGIGEKSDEDVDAATGLEQLCQEIRPAAASVRSKSLRSVASKRSKKSVFATSDDTISSQARHSQKAYASETEDDSPTDDDDEESDSESMTAAGQAQAQQDEAEADINSVLVFMYGAASNKIGEAAACWLCRWGVDMLAYEEAAEALDVSADSAAGANVKESSSSAGGRVRRGTESHASGPPNVDLTGISKENIPLIWRRGAMNAKWARVVISSNAFFVRDERERYEFAKRVVELRRRVSILSVEEREWDELFATGIHYMHMAFNDLIEISQDVSLTTGKPYTPISVLQAAHWDQSVLRHHITYRHNSSSPSTPLRSPAPARDGSLGLSLTTAEIKEKLPSYIHGAAEANKTYYPVPVDSSSRIGDTTGLEGASMDQLFNAQATPSSPSAKSGVSKGFTSYAPDTFFGILACPRDAAACVAADPGGHASWAPFPPIRFGVEFWGLENLQEKARLTSQTIWYAGSLFNVYVQVVRKKGLQLGMYLHRLSSVETIPIPSSPPMAMAVSAANGEERKWTTGTGSANASVQPPVNIPTSSSTPSLYRPASRGTATTNAHSRPTTPTSSYSPPSTASTSPPNSSNSSGGGGLVISTSQHSHHSHNASHQAAPRPPPQPYRDPREAVRAHFTLLCMSPTGGALTRFTSAPDAFLVGRSWGWKSSALQTEELVDVSVSADDAGSPGAGTGAGHAYWMKKECSLRATVVLGVV